MINEETFVQYEVPMLYRVCTLKQPADDISLEFWDNLVYLHQIQISPPLEEKPDTTKTTKKYIQLLIAKGKEGFLTFWKFENSCIMFQKSIKIAYALAKEITTIKAFTIGSDKQNQNQTKTAANQLHLLVLGYFDGTTEVFQIKLEQNSLTLIKCLSVKNSSEEPVTDAAIHNNSNLFICRCHMLYFYPQLIRDLREKIISKGKEQLNSVQTLLKLKQLNSSSKISMHLSTDNLHIYNQIQGFFTFSVPSLQSMGSVIDSMKFLSETAEGDVIVSSADDSVKIIYAETNQIERIVGMKNFVSTIIVNDLSQEKHIELWFADMYGEIHYMLKKKKMAQNLKKSSEKKSISSQSKFNNDIMMFEQQVTKGIKITENGIKKILLAKNLLIIVDTQMNILIYDIVRRFETFTGRSVQ